MAGKPRHTPAALAVENIVIPQGADYAIAWYYTEGDALPAGWPDDWIGRAAVRSGYTGGSLLAAFHSGTVPAGGGEVVLETVAVDTVDTARVTLVLDDEASAAMSWADQADCVYQVELEHVPDSRVVRFVEGKATLSAEADTDA